ncbi:MAG: hypothetical protein AAF720_11655 [Pseudomonadota bacterium]
MREFTGTRFDEETSISGVGDLPNLADLMLVFAVGLIAALAAAKDGNSVPEPVETSAELPEIPADAAADGTGLEAVGRVFEDPETGKLYLIK